MRPALTNNSTKNLHWSDVIFSRGQVRVEKEEGSLIAR